MAKIEIGTHVNYRRRLHVVVGVTPMGVEPQLLELEDVESGRLRQVNLDDPELEFAPTSRASKDDAAETDEL